jgi:hypothetical protein
MSGVDTAIEYDTESKARYLYVDMKNCFTEMPPPGTKYKIAVYKLERIVEVETKLEVNDLQLE